MEAFPWRVLGWSGLEKLGLLRSLWETPGLSMNGQRGSTYIYFHEEMDCRAVS